MNTFFTALAWLGVALGVLNIGYTVWRNIKIYPYVNQMVGVNSGKMLMLAVGVLYLLFGP